MNITVYIILLISFTNNPGCLRLRNFINATLINVIGTDCLLVNWGYPLGEWMESLWFEPVWLLDSVDPDFALELKLTKGWECISLRDMGESIEKTINIFDEIMVYTDCVKIRK